MAELSTDLTLTTHLTRFLHYLNHLTFMQNFATSLSKLLCKNIRKRVGLVNWDLKNVRIKFFISLF